MAFKASNSRGTVSLVALCFIAVLGIVLASYMAVCSRTMTLSNRSFQASLSQQLAEFGLEEGLRAFNKNDWSAWSSTPTGITVSAWTLDATNHRASRTITYAAGKLAQGAVATVKIRIDNYDAPVLGSSWSSSKTYNPGDLVGLSGVWYRCVRNNSNTSPSLSPGYLYYWVPEPAPWSWRSNKAYQQDVDLVSYSGEWYRCTGTHTSSTTFDWSKWTWMAAPQLVMLSGTYYWTDQYVYRTSNDTWYRCTNGHTPTSFVASNWSAVSGAGASTPTLSWAYRTGVNYTYDDVVYYNQNWYRYINATPGNVTPGSNAAYWENALSGGTHGWSSGIAYNLGDTIYYSSTSQWYRCILAHTSSGTITPSSTSYWANTPGYSAAWDAAKQYSQNDTAIYNGVWYLSIQSSNTNQNPSYASTYWISSTTTNSTYRWDASTAYAANTYHCYDGVWYKCTTATTAGIAPNNTSYWNAAWANSSGVTTGAPVIYAEASITLPNNAPSRTQLRGTLGNAPLFPNAIGARDTLTITTGTGSVDSYDSNSGAYGGSNIGYSAVLAAGTSIAITGTTAVKGYLAWPTPASNISTGTTVKSASSPASPNLDATRISRSPYIPQFDILPAGGLTSTWSTVPKGTALPTATTANIGLPGATTPSRYYYNGNLIMGGGSSIIATLNINGPVILYINGDLTMTGTPNGVININNTGSAEIHIGGVLKVDSGSDGIKNSTLNPRNLVLLCDSTSSTTPFYNEGVNPFYGLIYLPKTTATGGLSFNYGDTNATTIYGAVSAASVTYTNNAILHYDTTLRNTTIGGVNQPYTVTEWRELPVVEQATMP